MTHHFSMPLSLSSSPPLGGGGPCLPGGGGVCRLTPVVSVAVTARRGTPARHRFPSLKFPASPFESASRQRAYA